MAIQLVPYNHAMRLGQGFNSYTQQICIDDAVVIDPERAENVVTNDGTTMRIIAEKNAAPSVWSRQPEVVTDNRAAATLRNHRLMQAVDEIDEINESPPEITKKVQGGSTNATDTRNRKATDVDSEEKDSDDEPSAATEESSDAVDTEETDSVDQITRDDLDEEASKTATSKAAKGAASAKEKPVSAKDESVSAKDESASDEDGPVLVKDKSALSQDGQASGKDEPASDEDELASTQEKSKSTEKESDNADITTAKESERTSRNLVTRKPAGRSSSDGAKAKTAQGSSKPTASHRTTSQTTLQRAGIKMKAEAAQKKEDEERKEREEKKIKKLHEHQEKMEDEAREDERARKKEDRAEQREVRTEKRKLDAKRREDAQKAIDAAADAKATSLEELKKIAAQNQFAERFAGMLENKQQYTFDASGSRGPSQTVSYTSRFVDRLSDVTEDMCISGSLSIKAGKIGGSGKGSFVDSDKFKESDLNFYISVKVVNQTINFKDALVYNPIKSVTKDDFKQVFGDSFISGFVEGGEFNALVSMKILNKAKKTDIQAEAKVALTAGSVNIEAQANVGIARSNIETNTETTIQVSWSGGGHIKPMDQQWDISSLMEAAARFPDLVAECPQRIYAILTKYETLRSFAALKPQGCTPLQYENAQLYTNALLDSFMSYKSLYKRLGENIFKVQGNTLEILPWNEDQALATTTNTNKGIKDTKTGLYPFTEDFTRFEASIKGLSDARGAIRRQMARIVNEVDLIEKDPKLATDEDHREPFQSPTAFETRVPLVTVPARLKRRTVPLTGRAIMAKELTEAEQKVELQRDEELANAPVLYNAVNQLSKDETAALDRIRDERPGIGTDMKVTGCAGSDTQGKLFNNLDIIQADWVAKSITVHIYRGSVSYVEVVYENGLLIGKGVKHDDAKSMTFDSFGSGERVISASIETGIRSSDQDKQACVLAIGLFTNRGRSFLATAPTEPKGDGKYSKDNVIFEKVEVTHYDGPIGNGTFKGFIGRSDDDAQNEGAIWRLGLIWGCSSSFEAGNVEVKPLGLSSSSSNTLIVTESQAAHSGISESPSWVAELPNYASRFAITFNPIYSEPPIMISGLARLDVAANIAAFDVGATHDVVTREKAFTTIRTLGSRVNAPAMSWLTIPRTDKHIETGIYEFTGAEIALGGSWIGLNGYIPFVKPFSKTPQGLAWICETKATGTNYTSWATKTQISADGISLQIQHISTIRESPIGMRVGWIAYDPDECPNIQTGNLDCDKGESRTSGRCYFPKKFQTTPVVFMAVRYFEAGSGMNLRLGTKTSGVMADRFDYEVGTWTDEKNHAMKRFGHAWIAVA